MMENLGPDPQRNNEIAGAAHPQWRAPGVSKFNARAINRMADIFDGGRVWTTTRKKGLIKLLRAGDPCGAGPAATALRTLPVQPKDEAKKRALLKFLAQIDKQNERASQRLRTSIAEAVQRLPVVKALVE